jgi:hypothetical protein
MKALRVECESCRLEYLMVNQGLSHWSSLASSNGGEILS